MGATKPDSVRNIRAVVRVVSISTIHAPLPKEHDNNLKLATT